MEPAKTQLEYLEQRLPESVSEDSVIDSEMLVAIEVRLIRDLIRLSVTSAEDVYYNPWWVSFWIGLNEEWLELNPSIGNTKSYVESLDLIRRWVLGISRMLDNNDINCWQEILNYSEHRTSALNDFVKTANQNPAQIHQVH
jgi:hypothetical protein